MGAKVSDLAKLYLGAGILAVLVLGAAGVFIYRKREAFDPTSQNNLANQAANGLVVAITGDKDATVGNKAFDAVDTVKGWFGFGEPDINAPVTQADIEKYRAEKAAKAPVKPDGAVGDNYAWLQP